MIKEHKDIIKTTMTRLGFNPIGNEFYKNENGVIVLCACNIRKNTLYISAMGKRTVYDDIHWKIIGMPECSNKKISEHITGPYALPFLSLYSSNVKMDHDPEQVVSSSIYEAAKTIDNILATQNLDELLLSSQMYDYMKCIVLISQGKTIEAKAYAEKYKDSINSDWVSLINYIRGCGSEGENSRRTIEPLILSNSTKHTGDLDSSVIDKLEWHYESARILFANNHSKNIDHLNDADEESIIKLACMHIACLCNWLLDNNALLVPDGYNPTDGMDYLLTCCDGTLIYEDIANEFQDFLHYYFPELYFDDYEDYLDCLGISSYELQYTEGHCKYICSLISKRYQEWLEKTGD